MVVTLMASESEDVAEKCLKFGTKFMAFARLQMLFPIVSQFLIFFQFKFYHLPCPRKFSAFLLPRIRAIAFFCCYCLVILNLKALQIKIFHFSPELGYKLSSLYMASGCHGSPLLVPKPVKNVTKKDTHNRSKQKKFKSSSMQIKSINLPSNACANFCIFSNK